MIGLIQNVLIATVSVVFVLGVLVFVHEFGHFAAAKLFGVRVETFSLGFGKRIFGFRRGGTDYRISVLPFGGYVKMAGETPLDNHTGSPDEFMSHPRWQRVIIALAGPFMNIALAIAVMTCVFMVHDEQPVYWDQKAKVGYVVPNSQAEKAGVKAGDTIVKINGTDHPTWEDVLLKTMASPGAAVHLDLLRGDQVIATAVTPEKNPDEQGTNPGWFPDAPNVVNVLEPNMPAAKAGVQMGDVITSVNGVPVEATSDLSNQLQQTKNTPVDVGVRRGGQQLTLKMTPEFTKEGPDKEGRWRIGLILSSDPKLVVIHLPFSAALQKSLHENKSYSFLVVDLVRNLVRGAVSIKTISSPIGIARVSGEAAREPGWTPLMKLMAIVSLQLGIFNLFPIPILDGGMILMLLIESFMRRDISMRFKERAYQVAFVFLMLFATVVIYNDIVKGLHQHLP